MAEKGVGVGGAGVLGGLVGVHHVQAGARHLLPHDEPLLLPGVAVEPVKVAADQVAVAGLRQEPRRHCSLDTGAALFETLLPLLQIYIVVYSCG